MKPLREWSFARVVLVGVGWVVFCAGLTVLWIYLKFRSDMQMSGSAGIGAVSFGVVDVEVLIPLLPPIVLFVAWMIGRVRPRK